MFTDGNNGQIIKIIGQINLIHFSTVMTVVLLDYSGSSWNIHFDDSMSDLSFMTVDRENVTGLPGLSGELDRWACN